MPHPVTTTTWPTGDDLRVWLGPEAVSAVTDVELIEAMINDASAAVYERIDPDKLDEDTDVCPRSVHRAIVLDAARLLFRRQSPHGIAAFPEIAIRLRTADVDVDRLIQPWTLDPEP